MVATRYQIAVDTLGSESPKEHIVAGARDFVLDNPDCHLTLIGRPQDLVDLPLNDFRIVDCPLAIPPDANFLDVLRNKRESSMRTGLNFVAGGLVRALVSTGNSGALMVLGRQIIETLSGISRPVMIKEFSRPTGSFWMLDLGANLARRQSLLHEFARIGSAYATAIGGLNAPKIALLNIGTEARKGPQYLRGTAAKLAQDTQLNFVGYVEANHLFTSNVDVVVTDGFTGNVALKSIEGALDIALRQVRASLSTSKHPETLSVYRAVDSSLNAQTYNGASLVGLRGIIVKCHGNTDSVGLRSALMLAKREIQQQVPQRLAVHFDALEGVPN